MEVGCRLYVREPARDWEELLRSLGRAQIQARGCLQVEGVMEDLRDRGRNWSKKHAGRRQENRPPRLALRSQHTDGRKRSCARNGLEV
jgi:hypothetical protein